MATKKSPTTSHADSSRHVAAIPIESNGKNNTSKPSAQEKRSDILLKKIATIVSRPGIPRAVVFSAGTIKPIYAYSIIAADPTKIVREDASGIRVIGKLVNGRFRKSASLVTVQ